MKNNKPLSLEQLRNLIFEGLSINELEVVDTAANQAPVTNNTTPVTAPVTSPEEAMTGNDAVGIDERYNKLTDQSKQIASEEIAYILRTGRSHMTLEFAKHKRNYDVFNYVTSKVGDIYHEHDLPYDVAIEKLKETGNQNYVRFYELFVGQRKLLKAIATELGMKSATEVREQLKDPVFRLLQGEEQTKIKNALMSIFSPMQNGKPTIIMELIRKEVGGFSGEGKKDITDIVMTSYYPSFEKALTGYDSDKGTFYNYLLKVIKDYVIRMFDRVKDGYRIAANTSSLDASIDDSDAGAGTFGDNVISSDDENQSNDSRFTHAADAQMDAITNKLDKGKKQTERELLYHAVVDYVKNVLETGRSKVAWDIFNLLFIQQIPPVKAAEQLNISRSFLDKKVSDIKKLINSKMEDFKQHLGNELGRDVELPDGKFNPTVNSIAQKKVKLKEELMAIMGPLVLEVCAAKFKKINEAEQSINKIAGLLKESHLALNISEDNSEIGTQDLYSRVKEFVEVTINSLNKLGVELHHITDIAQEIKIDYPAISEQMEGMVYPMVDTLFEYPHRLQKMLDMIHHLYNRNANRLN